jgi:tetratricopeptide (TPR) repeat protein
MRRSIKSEFTSHNFQGQQERQIIQLLGYDLKESPSPIQDDIATASEREDRQGPQANTDSMRSIPLLPVLDNGEQATTFLTQMLSLAKDHGGVGQDTQIESLKQRIEALPKPARGDRKAARLQNDKGLEAFKKEQFDQAFQYFLTAHHLDPSDVEVVNNVGFAALKTGDLRDAAHYLRIALSMTPTRATAWANLANVYARSGRIEDAVAAYALTFRFSTSQDTTRRFLEQQAVGADDPQVMEAAQQALALPIFHYGTTTVTTSK